MNKNPSDRRAPRVGKSAVRQSVRRLRKPTMLKTQATAPTLAPARRVPSTAQQRRRRNTLRPVLTTAQTLRQALASARLISLAMLLMCVYALYLIAANDYFFLNTIVVHGTVNLVPAQVVEASELGGQHIFAANPSQAAEAISQLPGVRSATVQLQWPQEVVITIQEETPVLVWEEGGQRYWVNVEGRFIPVVAREAQRLLRVVAEMPLLPAALAPAVATATATPDSLPAGTGEAAEAPTFRPQTYLPFMPQEVLVGAQQLVELRPNIDQLFYTPYGGLSYQDGRGWRAYFGVGHDMAEKIVIYEAIVETLLARQVAPEYINVSNPHRPYYRAP